jgi:hypothetical protein
MRGPRWLVLLVCFSVSAFGPSAVKAGGGGNIEGGTITFVGAVVEPTCSIAAEPDALSAATSTAGLHVSLQRSCSGPAGAEVDTSRIYDVGVEHLSGAESDQVLRYFASYVRAALPTSADPVLVTQTFE